jgi:ubiquinone/menaquinone biosynthesis C-methylase UbiE
VNRPLTIVEIGCGKGGSLQMWKRYFGPHAQIVGLAIRPECANFEEDRIDVRVGRPIRCSLL